VTSVRIIDRIEPVAREWDRLIDCLGGTPFQRPGWIEAWWSAFGWGPLHVLCAWRGSRLVGVLPVAGHGRHLRSPTNSESFEFGPVAEDEAVTQALLGTLLSHGAQRISINYLDGERIPLGTWRQAVDEAGYRLVIRARAQSPSVVIHGDWRAYEAALAKGFRSDLRRCRRRLAEQGDLTVAACDGVEGVAEALGDLLRLEAAGWKGQQGTAIASRPPVERFYRSVADWAAKRGSLRLFSLRLDGRAVAVLYGLEEQGTCYAMKAGYDPAARRFSPGKLLLHSVIEHAFSAGLARVELLGVDDPYKRHWANAHRESLELEAFGASPWALLEWLAFAYGRPLARNLGLRRVLRPSGPASRARPSAR
jgi:CelD/BcsL family acetyltransferase involved in cellulose biosynthesis